MGYQAELTAIQSRFAGAWGAAPPVYYGNDDFTPPATGEYVVLYVLNGAENAISLGAHVLFRNAGVIQVSIYVPTGSGEGRARELADSAAAIFRGKRFSGVLCRGAALNTLGPTGKHYRVDVSINFQRDQAHAV